MIALQIEDIRNLTGALFLGKTFDEFKVREVQIVTYNTFHIDGHIRKGFYSEDEKEIKHIQDFSTWEMLRPVSYSLIKGKKLPESFKIILQLPEQKISEFLPAGCSKDFYINIQYSNHILMCITAASDRSFSTDKSAEREWDAYIKEFLRKNKVAFIEK